jgi:hypothetical protein
MFSAHRFSEKHVFSPKNGPVPRQPALDARRKASFPVEKDALRGTTPAVHTPPALRKQF